MTKVCNRCGVTLIPGENWLQGDKNKNWYICRDDKNRWFKSRDNYIKDRFTGRTNVKYESTRLRNKVSNFIQDTRKRGKKLELSKKEIAFYMKGNCFYCGKREDKYNGLDRINSRLGYNHNNVVTSCAKCNRAKNSMSTDKFIRHCEDIVNYQRGRNGRS